MDDDQKAFILLPAHGKHLLEGPPGSGKTNLLLLRAQYMAGQGDKNVLIITYTKVLADFIRSGIGTKGLINENQIRTYHSWAREHVLQHLGQCAISKESNFDETRAELLRLVLEANKRIPSSRLYSAIFVDEAQDFSISELEALLSLSDRVCICGDSRQGIYFKDGLNISESLGLMKHSLKRHFRIGQRIAQVADRLLPPLDGNESLEATSNYNPQNQGESSSKIHSCVNRDEQFERMLALIRVQLEAFNGDSIGIICGKKDTCKELSQRFNKTDLKDLVYAHGIDEGASFGMNRFIHILTIHAAKGTEFRAVHMYGTEELAKHPFQRTTLSYTAITRAKTALNAYRTGNTSNALENAFAESSHFDLDDLFSGGA